MLCCAVPGKLPGQDGALLSCLCRQEVLSLPGDCRRKARWSLAPFSSRQHLPSHWEGSVLKPLSEPQSRAKRKSSLELSGSGPTAALGSLLVLRSWVTARDGC